jgi:hypothetical protein
MDANLPSMDVDVKHLEQALKPANHDRITMTPIGGKQFERG